MRSTYYLSTVLKQKQKLDYNMIGERSKAKTKYSPVSCLLGKKIREGRSEKDFIFYFIFILFLVDKLSNNDLSL